MGAQLDALIDKLQQAQTSTKAIADQKQLLDNYKTTRQTYADLVTQAKADLDALTTANTQILKDLATAIQAAFP